MYHSMYFAEIFAFTVDNVREQFFTWLDCDIHMCIPISPFAACHLDLELINTRLVQLMRKDGYTGIITASNDKHLGKS